MSVGTEIPLEFDMESVPSGVPLKQPDGNTEAVCADGDIGVSIWTCAPLGLESARKS